MVSTGRQESDTDSERGPFLKYAIIHGIRESGLLKLADSCKYLVGRAFASSRNRAFQRRHPDFPTPPEHLAFDALNHFDWEAYRDSGERHAREFAEAIRAALPEGPLRILEWGCGPGRLIRHLPALLADRQAAITGTDYNPESIGWCRANLTGIEFTENGLNPPLPFEDGSFDVVYNFSVFTHLSEDVQLAWAKELHRVLRPGGVCISTTHGERYRYLLATDEEQRRFDADECVVQGKYQEGKKWFFALHPEAFVIHRLLADFTEVRRLGIDAERCPDLLQDFWLARKPAA